MCNTQLHERQGEKTHNEHAVHIGVEMMVLCFCVVLVNPCLIIYHCCEKECWLSFLSSLRVLACTDTIHLQPVTQQAGHEFCGNSMHVQIAFQNALG